MTYRDADQRARADQLAEELEAERAEARRLRALLPGRTRASMARALETLAGVLRGRGLWILAACVAVPAAVWTGVHFWNAPNHEHVLFEGKPAFLTTCSGDTADCFAEARAECGKFIALQTRSTFHPEVTTYVPVQVGQVTVMTPQTTPAHFTHEFVYQCEPKGQL